MSVNRRSQIKTTNKVECAVDDATDRTTERLIQSDFEPPQAPDTFTTSLTALDTLKCATRQAHQRLHRVVDLQHVMGSQQHYFDSLRQYLSIIDPLEQGLLGFHEQNDDRSSASIDWPARLRKSTWLREDLEQIACFTDMNEPSQETALSLPVSTWAAFVGRTYVLEGLTLGAVPILRMIARAPALKNVGRRRFFSGYRERTPERWRDYRKWVCEQPINTQAAVDEALTTFDLFAVTLHTELRPCGIRNKVG